MLRFVGFVIMVGVLLRIHAEGAGPFNHPIIESGVFLFGFVLVVLAPVITDMFERRDRMMMLTEVLLVAAVLAIMGIVLLNGHYVRCRRTVTGTVCTEL